MNLQDRYLAVKEILAKNNQLQLLKFYDTLADEKKTDLLAAIESLEWDNINEWIEKYVKSDASMIVPADFDPATYYPAEVTDEYASVYEAAIAKGSDLISNGKVAAFMVAGGQGTRLGFDGPKGSYPTSSIKNKTLFQLFAEQILAVAKKYDTVIPWYIMTSPLNHQATVETFEGKDYFGLNKCDVVFFQQGTLPNFDFDGNILLSSLGEIASSPDGHGGSLKALYKSGAIADMQKRGIEQISYFQVDNPLINIVDPLFIGLHAIENAQMSSKTLLKAYAKEKVGNFCLVDGRVNVIEYSDLPDEFAEQKTDDGKLVFELGSIAIHIVSVGFVEKLNAKGFGLPIHRAVKKIPFVDDSGNVVKPTEANGVKLETFVFDALPFAEKSIILETLREDEFAPVKNATGTDSAEVTRQMMDAKYKVWLKAAGVEVDDSCVVEISPLFAVNAQDVVAKKDKLPEIKPGDKIYIS